MPVTPFKSFAGKQFSLIFSLPSMSGIDINGNQKGRAPLLYARSLKIEQRLSELLATIRKEGGSAEKIAAKLGVSTATVARGIAALRHRGHKIKAVRCGTKWSYRLAKQLKDAT